MKQTRNDLPLKDWLVVMEEFLTRKTIKTYENDMVFLYLTGNTVEQSVVFMIQNHPEFERMEYESVDL